MAVSKEVVALFSTKAGLSTSGTWSFRCLLLKSPQTPRNPGFRYENHHGVPFHGLVRTELDREFFFVHANNGARHDVGPRFELHRIRAVHPSSYHDAFVINAPTWAHWIRSRLFHGLAVCNRAREHDQPVSAGSGDEEALWDK